MRVAVEVAVVGLGGVRVGVVEERLRVVRISLKSWFNMSKSNRNEKKRKRSRYRSSTSSHCRS